MKRNKDSIGDFFHAPKPAKKKRAALILISLKVTKEQHKKLVAKAKRRTRGNVSALIRTWAEEKAA